MKEILYLVIIALLMPLMASAQSSNDVIDLDLDILTDSISASDLAKLGNLSAEDKAYRSKFLKDLKTTGQKINEISEVWSQETAKRGYPKKKTVKAKAALIDHYIFLMSTQLSDARLNRVIDKKKVQDKILYWQNYRTNIEKLM